MSACFAKNWKAQLEGRIYLNWSMLYKLQCSNCKSVCNDGCPSMQGKTKDLLHLCSKIPKVVIVHCMIHREALMAKSLPEDLQVVMSQVSQELNFIKSRPL